MTHYALPRAGSGREPRRDEPIQRPASGPGHDEDGADGEDEEVVLEPLSLERAGPVHEESHAPVADGDGADHDGRDAQSGQAPAEARGEAEASERLDENDEEGEGGRHVELSGEISHRPLVAVPAEPAEELLRSVGKHDEGEGHAEDEPHPSALGPEDVADHVRSPFPLSVSKLALSFNRSSPSVFISRDVSARSK